MRTQIWSSGGGVQSTAIAALICQGELKPDLSIIVDTEYEKTSTWEYLDKWVNPALEDAGVVLHRVAKSKYATVGLYSANGDILIPAFTDESGKPGKLPTFCSTEWKQRVMRRWANDQGVTQADIWIGFTIDELRRVKTPVGKWQHSFPLIDRRMTRADCIKLVDDMGWPTPPRSSCWMCPNAHGELAEIMQGPDREKVIKFEREIRKNDDCLYLHPTCQPIDSVSFEDNQGELFTCNSGMCFV